MSSKPDAPLQEGPLILSARWDDHATLHRLSGGRAVCFSRARPGAESGEANQDSAAVIPVPGEGLVLAVADGAGGHRGGAEASRAAIAALTQTLRRAPERSLRSRILDGFEAANAAVRALGQGGVTTLAVVTVEKGEVRAFHAGDSTVLVTGQRGRLKMQTIDHTPAGYAIEAGMIDEEQAMVHEERHLLTNVVGREDMRIDIGPPTRLARRDTLVIGSDGLFDNATIDEIVDAVRCGDLRARADRLAQLARMRMETDDPSTHGKPDDLTFLLYRPS